MLVNGNIVELKPTDPVLKLSSDGKLEKLWHGYSATTMRHINSFCDTFGIDGGGKRWWENL